MEPEGSSPHSQAHATCPYPELAPSSPHTHIPLPEDPSKYYPPIYVWVSPVVSFPQVSPPKPCTHLSPPPYALHAPTISFFLILSPARYWVRSTDWKPRYRRVETRKFSVALVKFTSLPKDHNQSFTVFRTYKGAGTA